MKAYRLPERLRPELQAPWGPVVEEGQLEGLLPALDGDATIAVGDATTASLIRRGFIPKIQVCDSRIMRERVEPPAREYDLRIRVRNPPGHITEEAHQALVAALRSKGRCYIEVEGEEDLIGLAAIAEAPDGWFVLYGQPHRGMVVVRVDQAVRNRARSLLLAMPRVELASHQP